MSLLLGFDKYLYCIWTVLSILYFLHFLFELSSSPGSSSVNQSQDWLMPHLGTQESRFPALSSLEKLNTTVFEFRPLPTSSKAWQFPWASELRIKQKPVFAPGTPGKCDSLPFPAEADGSWPSLLLCSPCRDWHWHPCPPPPDWRGWEDVEGIGPREAWGLYSWVPSPGGEEGWGPRLQEGWMLSFPNLPPPFIL